MSGVKLILNFLLWPNENPDENLNSVEIDGDAMVNSLKKMIKDAHPLRLRNFESTDLVVWKCSIPADDNLQNALNSLRFDPTDTRLCHLPPVDQISEHFTTDLPRKTLNILVQVPFLENEATPLLPGLLKERQQFNAQLLSTSPSSHGYSANFSKIQETDSQKIVWSRPPDADSTIPVTLYHSIFRRFVDDCKNHQPIAEDNKLVLELMPAMSQFFPSEDARAAQFRQILKDNGIWVCRSSISSSKGQSFSADGAIYCDHGQAPVIIKLRGEIGSTGAEPYAQAILYYAHFDWKKSEEYPTFNFPCLIITLFGPQISFSGAVWRDRPHFQVLTPTMPLFCHQTDTDMRESLARHFGALKNAIASLEHCYNDTLTNPALLEDLDPRFPDPCTYRSLETKAMVKFKYRHQVDEKKLLFIGENDNGERICIKFVRRYSQAAHEKCAEMGIAPKLKGFEDIGAGWKMVIMDAIDEKYEPFDKRNPPLGANEYLRERLVELHRANFVHGDVRDVNIMVRKDEPRLMLIDFDWSGIIGEVRYPINVNNVDMWRPEDASDGLLIKPDHDIAMLDHIFHSSY